MTKKKSTKKPRKGQITKKEMKQTGMVSPRHKGLDNDVPVEALRGIGPKRGKSLRRRGIKTVGDLDKAQTRADETGDKKKADKLEKLAGYDPFRPSKQHGVIIKKELQQTDKYLDKRGKLKAGAPVEVIKGIGHKKGKELRKQRITTVGAFIRHQEKLAKKK